jgi:predicted aspartyl protease
MFVVGQARERAVEQKFNGSSGAMKTMLGLAILVSTGVMGFAQAGSPAQTATVSRQCMIAPPPSEGDEALWRGRYDEAEKYFASLPASSAATAGMVRTQLGQHKLKEALVLAEKEVAAHPNDALLQDVLGEVRFRRGEVVEAAEAFNRSIKLDPCLGRTHYDAGRYLNMAGMYKSAQGQLEMAHKLAPKDPAIDRAYQATHRVPQMPEERIVRLKERAASPTATEEQKAAYDASIKAIESRQKGDCELASPVTSTKFPMMPMGNEASVHSSHAEGLDVSFDGHRKRLQLDTGASGMSITREAAKSLGLTPEAEMKMGGLGDSGAREAFVTHVGSIRVGGMEFHNCMVRVFETKNVLDGRDGLIGADVFRSFVVTLDFPSHEIRLGPLPKRPDEAEEKVSLETDSDDAAPQTIAETRKDRYVAPEMADWSKVFRSGHFLIFPTQIGNAPKKLFVMDTGASLNLISPDAAREVAHVSSDTDMRIRGISGDVKNVFGTGAIDIQFANVRQQSLGMTAIDTTGISRGTGVEIAGFIGYQTLRELTISIDYRDNLVHVVYKPHIGSNGR